MGEAKKPSAKPEARLPKGMRDIESVEIRAMDRMLNTIRQVYESYGFEPLDTPAFEYTDTLGKFLPDEDRPNEGVFSFQDEDEQWLSLRYDLTAPLARYVAQNYDALPKPFRRYQTGPVWRNEKPGPGRFRQFLQFDADTVGTDNVAADAEMCMLAADTLEALGLKGQYCINVSSRKILDGLLETIGLGPNGQERMAQRLTILRALDKLDKFSLDDVTLLLGEGRKDESGDFTKGAGLKPDQIDQIIGFLERLSGGGADNATLLISCAMSLGPSTTGIRGIDELRQMAEIWEALGYNSTRIRVNPAVVRGLEYYTGPVFEAELTFEAKSDTGAPMRFGSVGGGVGVEVGEAVATAVLTGVAVGGRGLACLAVTARAIRAPPAIKPTSAATPATAQILVGRCLT